MIQHLVVTWAFATDQANFREEAAFDYRWFVVSGAIVAVLFAAALIGYLRRTGWSIWLFSGLAAFDIVGEFAYQGSLGILITVSFVVAVTLLLLGIRELRRTPELPEHQPPA